MWDIRNEDKIKVHKDGSIELLEEEKFEEEFEFEEEEEDSKVLSNKFAKTFFGAALTSSALMLTPIGRRKFII